MKMQRSLLFGGVEISALHIEAGNDCKFTIESHSALPRSASPDRSPSDLRFH
jgi:hypothetical protein